MATPCQGQFVVHRLGLAMINVHTKYEVSKFIHYKDVKGNAKCRNWSGFRGCFEALGSPKVTSNVTI